MIDGRLMGAAGQVEVEEARICYGGVAPKCIMATNAQAALEGQPWNQATLDAALLAVAKDVNITPDAPGLAAASAAACVLPCDVLSSTTLHWIGLCFTCLPTQPSHPASCFPVGRILPLCKNSRMYVGQTRLLQACSDAVEGSCCQQGWHWLSIFCDFCLSAARRS